MRPLEDGPAAFAALAGGPPPAEVKVFLRPASREPGLIRMSLREETSEFQRRTMKRVATRLIPVLLGLYIIAYLDRVNVTFAQDKLESDLGFSGAVYGFGAGVFFIAYFFLEVPSNLALHKFGARKWIARIMLTWGSSRPARCSCRGRRSFYLVRFLLGMAEAGFFPGMILYLVVLVPGP